MSYPPLLKQFSPIESLNPEEIPVVGYEEAVASLHEAGFDVKYLPLLEELRRCNAEDDFVFLPFWGKPRKGKSTLALILLNYLLGGWDDVLHYFVYNLPELLTLMYETRREKKILPLIVWDDFGVHGGKRTKSFDQAHKSFSELFDAIGKLCHGLVATGNRPDGTIPALRERYHGEVLVDPRGHFNYVSYEWKLAYYLPGQPYFAKIWVEESDFGKVPDEIYKKYDEDRVRLLDVKMAEVEGMLSANTSIKNQTFKMTDIDIDILKKIAIAAKGSVRDDHLKNGIGVIGYSEFDTKMSLAKVESAGFAIKRNLYWLITEKGRAILENPKKD